MSQQGWVKLHRKMRECWIWEEKEGDFMCPPKIAGGYIIISRNIVESEIWDKPPLYTKVWLYILNQAQHADYKKLKRGQLFISIPDIIEGCSWHVGYRKEKPTKDQIYQIIDWLRKPNEGTDEKETKATMITTVKATQGLLITIDNYSFYQNPKNYEGNDEEYNEVETKATSEQQQPDNINKNDKNDKNDKEIIIMTASEEKFISILKTIENYPIDMQKDKDLFNTLSERYPTLDLIQAIKDWSVYKEDAPLKPKCNARSQINTSFKKYVEWGRCIKNNSSISHKVNVRKTAAIINEPDSKYVDYQ